MSFDDFWMSLYGFHASWWVVILVGFSPKLFGFLPNDDTSHLTGYPLRHVGGFKYPMLRKVTSEVLPLVFGNLTTF